MKKHEKTAVIAIALLAGCISTSHAQTTLTEHPNDAVRYPAQAGQTLGLVAGIPVGAALMIPGMIIFNALPVDEETKAWSGLYPVALCQSAGTILIGRPAWLCFGWWGNGQSGSREPDLPDGERKQHETKTR